MGNSGSAWVSAFGIGLFMLGEGCGSSSNTASEPRAGAGGQSALSNGGNSGANAVGNGGASGSAGNAGSNASSAGANASVAGNAGGSGTEASTCAGYAAAYCGFVLNCGPVAFYDAFGTMGSCVASHTASCLDRFSAPGAQLTPADLAACNASLASPSCAEIHTPCHFQGALANGAPCAYDAQCQSTVCIVPEWEADCGVCGPQATLGEACHQLNGCTADLQCSLGGDTRDTCVKVLPDGSACDPNQFDCENSNCDNGVCQPAPRANAACSNPCDQTDDTECLGGVCKPLVWNGNGGDCDSETGVLCLGGFECNPVGGPGKCEVAMPSAPSVAADCE